MNFRKRIHDFYVNRVLTTGARENFYIEVGEGKTRKSMAVSSVAVTNGDYILMGKRKDSGKYTLPGGHLEVNEDMADGACRELLEEAGVQSEPRLMEHLKTQDVMCEDGKKRTIHAFRLRTDGPPHHSKFDPDEEVDKWEWIGCKDGLPKRVTENLHSPKNVVLESLGLIKSEICTPKKEMVDEHTRLVAVLDSPSRKDDKTESKKQKKELEEYKKKSFFIHDLFKADRPGPHKYIRKYRRGNKWIYVYHETGQRGRRIDEAVVEIMRKLATAGHEHRDSGFSPRLDAGLPIHTHDEKKLKILRELADAGHEGANRQLTEFGINREEEKLEEQLTPAAVSEKDELDKVLSTRDKSSLLTIIEGVLREKIFGYLGGQRSSPYWTKMQEQAVSHTKVMEFVDGADSSIRGMLTGLHHGLKLVDKAHKGLPASRAGSGPGSPAGNDPTNSGWGAYGNLAYNDVVKKIESFGMLPSGYAETHQRQIKPDGTGDAPQVFNPEDLRAKQKEKERKEREKREREEQRVIAQNAELFAKHGDSVNGMMEYFGKAHSAYSPSRFTAQEKGFLVQGINKMFGDDFNFEKFRAGLQGNPKVEIAIPTSFMDGLIAFGRGRERTKRIGLNFRFYKIKRDGSRGAEINTADRSVTKHEDGSLQWHNSHFHRPSNANLKEYPRMASGLYIGVERFLKDITKNYVGAAKENTYIDIGSCANSGWSDVGYKGALVWAKHGFDWTGTTNKTRWREHFTKKIDEVARNAPEILTPEVVSAWKTKINSAEYPYQFVRTGLKLNKEESKKVFGRASFDWDWDQLFDKGKIDIGATMLIESVTRNSDHLPSTSWSGINYINKTTGRHGHLNKMRTEYYNQIQPLNVFVGDSPPVSQASQRVSVAISSWQRIGRSGYPTITMSAERKARVKTWEQSHIKEFIKHAPISAAAKRDLKKFIRENG